MDTPFLCPGSVTQAFPERQQQGGTVICGGQIVCLWATPSGLLEPCAQESILVALWESGAAEGGTLASCCRAGAGLCLLSGPGLVSIYVRLFLVIVLFVYLFLATPNGALSLHLGLHSGLTPGRAWDAGDRTRVSNV